MSQPLIRNGKLVGNPLPSAEFDLAKLDPRTTSEASDVMQKAQSGKSLTASDAQVLLKARNQARTTVLKADTIKMLSEQLTRLKQVFK